MSALLLACAAPLLAGQMTRGELARRFGTLRDMPWLDAVHLLQEQLDFSLPVVYAELTGGPEQLSLPDSVAWNIEQTEIWWMDYGPQPNAFMVFRNMHTRPLRGIVLEVADGMCSRKGRVAQYTLTFREEVAAGSIVAANFALPSKYSLGTRCIEVVATRPSGD